MSSDHFVALTVPLTTDRLHSDKLILIRNARRGNN